MADTKEKSILKLDGEPRTMIRHTKEQSRHKWKGKPVMMTSTGKQQPINLKKGTKLQLREVLGEVTKQNEMRGHYQHPSFYVSLLIFIMWLEV